MNGFLVLLCHNMDDLPVFLTDNEDAAMKFASELDAEPSQTIRQVFNTDCSTPNCVKVVLFVGGKPVGVRYVKGFDACLAAMDCDEMLAEREEEGEDTDSSSPEGEAM